MAKIEDLLHRRTDLSTFLVHLTRAGSDGTSGRDNLLSIIEAGEIEARTPLGLARDHESTLAQAGVSQKVVCFTETPLEHVWMMLEDIDYRSIHFEPYGLATTKAAARHGGCNPVWYSDMTRLGIDWPLKHVGDLVSQALARCKVNGSVDPALLAAEPIFRLTPYFETMGPMSDGGRKEFWWEREWRHIGGYHLSFPSRVVAILAPEDEHEGIAKDLAELGVHDRWLKRPMVDPRWGLERMIAAMARVNEDYVGPFPERN